MDWWIPPLTFTDPTGDTPPNSSPTRPLPGLTHDHRSGERANNIPSRPVATAPTADANTFGNVYSLRTALASATVGSGLRVEVSVADLGECTVAAVSARTEASVTSVARASTPDAEGRITEEFTVEEPVTPPQDAIAEIASYSSRSVYRFQRSEDTSCVCEQIEAFGSPVSDIRATNGSLHVSFHAPDLETVQDIVTELRDRFSGIRLRKLTRSTDDATTDPVFVDRDRLTARQRDVLRTAYEMGYFDRPRRANAGEVADALDVTCSTFSEHFASAQRKILKAVLAI